MLDTDCCPTLATTPACLPTEPAWPKLTAPTTPSPDDPRGIPAKSALRAEYDEAVREIDQGRERPMLTNGFYAQIGDIVFDAGWQALQDCIAAEQADIPGKPRLHVVSAPAGGGKTSFAIAMLAASVRATEANEGGPMGGLFLRDQIVRADETYRELSELLPGKVAIWTKDHDREKPSVEPKVLTPAARFSVDELERYPVVVVTHEFFKNKNGHKARTFQGRPRALIFVDERPNETDPFDVQLSQADQVLEHVQADDANRKGG